MPLPTTSVVLWDRGLQTYLLSHIDSLRTAIFYDLNGRRITSPDRKGIYIQNHHKIVRQ
jgi:hypothetical protein